MIKSDSIETLKQIIDIVDIIGNYLELHKAGSSYKAICPFHDEKTPSLVINAQKGFFYCFGCNTNGDAIKFVMEYEKIDYKEAILKIASLYHFSLEYTHHQENFNAGFDLLAKVNDFFMQNLVFAHHAIQYIHQRLIDENSQKKFQLGYAPSDQQIMNYLNNNSTIDLKEALKLGVIGEDNRNRKKQFFSRFTNRIIFPIHSPQGKIVGFGGRALSQDAHAKYINTPQTILFNKSRLLYGYHLAKESIYKRKQIIITEGYIDVILLHQAGFTQSVATLGTALSKDHLPLITKGEPRVLLAYDGDKAGRSSALKAAYLLAHKEGGIVLFPEGLDPADMVASNQTEMLTELFNKPTPFIQFILEEIAHSHDLSNPLQKEKAYNTSLNFLKTLSPLLQEEYTPLLSHILNISEQLVEKQIPSPAQKATRPSYKKDATAISLILFFMQHPNHIEYLFDVIDSDLFEDHQEELELIKKGDLNHPKLLHITDITKHPILSSERLDNQIRAILLIYYNKILKRIHAKKDIPPDKKMFLFRDIRSKIKQLAQGEMITYESFSTL